MSGLSKNKIKWIRSLQLKKFRDASDLYIVEGEKMITEALEHYPQTIDCVFYLEGSLTVPDSIQSVIISEKELEQISGLRAPNKAVAIIKKQSNENPSKAEGLILALDDVQDPGNMGTILRIADWFGIQHIVCSNNTVECFNPKVVQATMGAIFRINVSYCDLSKYLSESKLPIYGALLEGENIYKATVSEPAILLMGNEGKGISRDLIPFINYPVMIPRFGKAESLNVSIATGILVSEFKRRSN